MTSPSRDSPPPSGEVRFGTALSVVSLASRISLADIHHLSPGAMVANASNLPGEPATRPPVPLTRAPSADDLRRAGIRTSVAGLISRLPTIVQRPLRIFESNPPPSATSSSGESTWPPPPASSTSTSSASSSALGKRKADPIRPAAPAAPFPESRRKRRKSKRTAASPISYDMYPHLVETIMKHADVTSLIAFRGTCHAVQALADQRLQRLAESDPRHGTPLDRRLSWVHGTHRRTRLPRYTAIDWVYVHGPTTATAGDAEKARLVVPPGTQRHVVYLAFTVSSTSVEEEEAKQLHETMKNTISVKWAADNRPRFVNFVFVPDYLEPATLPPPRTTAARDFNPFHTEGDHVHMPGMLGDLARKFNLFHLIRDQGGVRFIGLELLTPTLIQSTVDWPQLHGERLSRAVMQVTHESFKRYINLDDLTAVEVRSRASRLMAEKRKF